MERTKVIEITQKPKLCQKNNSLLNPELEQTIARGEKRIMDDKIYNAFKAHLEESSKLHDNIAKILKVMVIVIFSVILLSAIIRFIVVTVTLKEINSVSILVLLLSAIPSIGVIAASIVMLKLSYKAKGQREKNNKILKYAIPGVTECYIYNSFLAMKHTYLSGDSIEHDYYINLLDFVVEIANLTKSWRSTKNVYAVVLNVNGKDMFFLFEDS